jgi:manganese/zinc/iron transport system permease protein
VLQTERQWSATRMKQLLGWGLSAGLLRHDAVGCYRLTATGRREAVRAVHRHRLWEWFLIQQTQTPATRVDRTADAIEHYLPPDVMEQLEQYAAQTAVWPLPKNPHGGMSEAMFAA